MANYSGNAHYTTMQSHAIEHAQQPVNNRVEPTVRPANQFPKPPSDSPSRASR
ncbi:hypothetical protein P2P98_09905 [Microbacterium sp. Kw_RZR3]|uniref:hypothetical protein n=1 Tax=Microbacterium sp. Kw_RZR3 TaxID=3032903 RepID=UPI0023DA6C2E|nr:hypothetical protein [Microbacterium sp. Kw_RZR3]MDF2046470.1 hypothetical protein [Microbacterium sp. Kw_RZR3]